MWNGPPQRVRGDPTSQPEELPEVSGTHQGMAVSTSALEAARPATPTDGDAAWLLSVLRIKLQRSTAEVLSAIYEQDFMSCSFGGRPGRGAHQALATLHERIAGGKIEWVLEADLKNFFGSLSHEWTLRFVEHRVGDRRLSRFNPLAVRRRTIH